MKRWIALGVGLALLLSAAAATAQEATPPPPGAKQKAQAQPKEMMGQIDEQIKKMQALHERMIGATTADERQRAIEDARTEMQVAMAMMRPAVRGSVPEADPAVAEAMEFGTGAKGKRGQGRAQALTGKRVDLMQMVIQLMLDQQTMMATPSPKDGGAPKKKKTQ